MRIDWSPVPIGAGWEDLVEEESIVWIDVAKLDASWRRDHAQRDHALYVGSGGAGSNIKGRYERVGEWIKSAGRLFMPTVGLDDHGEIAFTDGRHRFAWLRDHGVLALPVMVSSSIAAEIEVRFGSIGRESFTPL